MNSQVWRDFIKALRREQDKLRAELKPYSDGTVQAPDATGRFAKDTKTIAVIEREIASLQTTIDRVVAEQRLTDA
jgi:hypothetical protein